MDVPRIIVTGIIFFILFVIGASFEVILMYTQVKDHLVKRFGQKGAYNLYNILMMVGMLPCFIFFVYATKYLVPGKFTLPRYSLFIGAALMIAGILIIFSSVRVLKSFRWMGRDIYGVAKEKDGLVTEGIYKYVRHPTYVGFILLFYGFFFVFPLIIIFITVISYHIYTQFIHSRVEETHLTEKFGDEYTQYMKRTPGFIPRPWRLGGSENAPIHRE